LTTVQRSCPTSPWLTTSRPKEKGSTVGGSKIMNCCKAKKLMYGYLMCLPVTV
jgi:hypothetical protein